MPSVGVLELLLSLVIVMMYVLLLALITYCRERSSATPSLPLNVPPI